MTDGWQQISGHAGAFAQDPPPIVSADAWVHSRCLGLLPPGQGRLWRQALGGALGVHGLSKAGQGSWAYPKDSEEPRQLYPGHVISQKGRALTWPHDPPLTQLASSVTVPNKHRSHVAAWTGPTQATQRHTVTAHSNTEAGHQPRASPSRPTPGRPIQERAQSSTCRAQPHTPRTPALSKQVASGWAKRKAGSPGPRPPRAACQSSRVPAASRGPHGEAGDSEQALKDGFPGAGAGEVPGLRKAWWGEE